MSIFSAQEYVEELVRQALAVRKKAYAPYSDFLVGAALITKDGTIFHGCNVENSSYGLAICAERNAICKAVADGHQEFSAIVVAAAPLASPCGACRQFIVEFGTETNVLSVNADNPQERKLWTIDDLIPDSFRFDG